MSACLAFSTQASKAWGCRLSNLKRMSEKPAPEYMPEKPSKVPSLFITAASFVSMPAMA